jgi:hypothetical protein
MTDTAQIGSRLAGLGVLVLFTAIVAAALYVAGATPFTPWVDHLIGR